MTIIDKNQNDIINSELIDSMDIEYVFSDLPINRFKTKPGLEDKLTLLNQLKEEILQIKNCDLKNSANNMVFSDGDQNSKIMIVGEGPGKKEDELSTIKLEELFSIFRNFYSIRTI